MNRPPNPLNKLLTFTLAVLPLLLLGNPKRPNILWIYVEDLNPFMSCYGITHNQTPNIDKLAKNGILYENAFSPSPVCSPTRSALITGMMATSINAHNHHSSRTVESGNFLTHQTLPELFREHGYFTFNDGKDDYNFIYDRQALYSGEVKIHYWYTFTGEGDWKNPERQPEQPFFGQVQLSGGKHALNRKKLQRIPDSARMKPANVDLPPYYPDIDEVRQDWADHYDTAKYTDQEVAQIIQQLSEDGELENTVVFFFSDHGYKGYRHKQFCYNGGLHVPLIIADFRENKAFKADIREDGIVNLLDVTATSLDLADISIPEHFESRNLLSESYHRDYVFSTRDRCDFSIDRIRSVRSKEFRYIRNFFPNRPYMQPSYRDSRPEVKAVRKMVEQGQLTGVPMLWWGENKPEEELYDVANDPHQIHNLANNPTYHTELCKLRDVLNQWMKETNDQGAISETETLQGIENLRFIKQRWGDKCVNPEYKVLENYTIPGSGKSKRTH